MENFKVSGSDLNQKLADSNRSNIDLLEDLAEVAIIPVVVYSRAYVSAVMMSNSV